METPDCGRNQLGLVVTKQTDTEVEQTSRGAPPPPADGAIKNGFSDSVVDICMQLLQTRVSSDDPSCTFGGKSNVSSMRPLEYDIAHTRGEQSATGAHCGLDIPHPEDPLCLL